MFNLKRAATFAAVVTAALTLAPISILVAAILPFAVIPFGSMLPAFDVGGERQPCVRRTVIPLSWRFGTLAQVGLHICDRDEPHLHRSMRTRSPDSSSSFRRAVSGAIVLKPRRGVCGRVLLVGDGLQPSGGIALARGVEDAPR